MTRAPACCSACAPSTSGCLRSPTRCACRGPTVVDVDWRPPGGGEAAVVALLERAWGAHGERVEAANATALRRARGGAPARADRRPGAGGDRRVRGPDAAARGTADRLGARVRPAAPRAGGGVPARGLGRRCLRGAGAPGHRRGAPALRQRVRSRRADDRRLLALDAGLGGAGRGHRRARLLDAQRGAGAHAVVRRRRRRGGRAGALPARPRRPAAGAPARAHGADRRARPRRPGAADGRRAAHAQPGDDEPALAPAAAGLRGRGRGGRRRRARRATTSSS